MKATDFLMKQHGEVQSLFTKILESDSPRRIKAFAAELKLALELHMAIEEDIFYPAYCDAVEAETGEDFVLEACEDHQVVRLLLSEIPRLDPSSEIFKAKITALKQLVEHHMQDEEKAMFPDALELLGKARLEEMRRDMEDREMQLAA